VGFHRVPTDGCEEFAPNAVVNCNPAQLLNLSKMIVINFPGVAGARLEVYIFEGTWRNISGKQD